MALGKDGVGRVRQAQKVSAGRLLCGDPAMIGCATHINNMNATASRS